MNKIIVDIKKEIKHTKPDSKPIISLAKILRFQRQLVKQQKVIAVININTSPIINKCWVFPKAAFTKKSFRF